MRKAAILVSSLAPQAADRLLEKFEPGQAQRVRQAMVDLGEIDPKEQQRIIEEFFRIGPMRPNAQSAGIELNDRLTMRLFAPQPPARPDDADQADSDHPFQFLKEAEADKLARALASERPQTIALVLSHLPTQQAGGVLARLEAPLQVEVVRRLVDLEETDPAILQEVQRALASRLSQQVHMQRRRVAGLKAVAGILEASSQPVGAQILKNLAARDRALADKLGPAPVSFDDLLEADDSIWAAIFSAGQPELIMLALVGAAPELIDRIVRPLAPAEAQIVRHKLDHPGPIRLRDVEQARQEVAAIARRLTMEGRIALRRRQPLPVAA